jgi:hypothetical protein
MKDILTRIATIQTDATSINGARRMATEIYKSGELPKNPGAQKALKKVMAQVKRTLGDKDQFKICHGWGGPGEPCPGQGYSQRWEP